MNPMHLDEELIQRVLHAELTPSRRQEVQSHLAGCVDCRSLVDEAQRDESRIFALLSELDHPLPRIPDEVAIASGRSMGWGRLVAGILIGILAAGAVYAASGRPLPKIFQRLVEWVAQNPVPAAPSAASSPQAPQRGIAVPAGDRLVILFSTTRGGQATITLSDDTEVQVRTLRGVASFTSDLDRLQVDSRSDSARFVIAIPRQAPLVEVQVGGRRVFLKEAGRVVTPTRPDPRGDYLIPLSW
jgi:hypothetical protein